MSRVIRELLLSTRGWVLLALLMNPAFAGEQFVDETDTRFPDPFDEYSSQVAVADIDGDGDLDITFVNGRGFATATLEEPVRIYINDGDGNFTDETDDRADGVEGYGRDVEYGDIDGDGDLDMVVANDFDTAPALLVNDGDGFFTDVSDTQLPDITLGSPHVALGDVDNDGDLDLCFANGGVSRFGAGQMQMWINDGDGNFTDETLDRLPEEDLDEPMDVIFGDVDGDFDLDLLAGQRSLNGSVLYINDGTGVFTEEEEFPADNNTYSHDFGDVDGDGDLDVIGVNSFVGNSRELILANDGNGVFTNMTPQYLPNSANPSVDDNDSKFFDVDMDGDLDLVIASLGVSERISTWDEEEERFRLETGIITANADSSLDVEVGDFDGDGTFDLVTAQGESGSFTNRIYMNNGAADDREPTFQLERIADRDTVDGPYVVRVIIRDDMTSDHGFHREASSLTYTVNGGDEETVDLIHAGHDLYRAEIPEQTLGSVITYQAHATDWAGNEGSSESWTFVVDELFLRGDVDNDGEFHPIRDAFYLIAFGFVAGSPGPPVCEKAADVDDDGVIDPMTDLLAILNVAYLAGPIPAAPYPDCGGDRTEDTLGCASSVECP